MNRDPAELRLPRRLAIALLAHAQKLPPGADIRGFLEGEEQGLLVFHAGEPPDPGRVWAWVRAQPGAGAPDPEVPDPVPAGAFRVLTVGLDTKGVLQLRCWERGTGPARERTLRISD